MPDAYIISTHQGSLARSIDWLVGLVSGQMATALAVLAVAFLGFQMLAGFVPMRRVVQTVLGCFVLFGAPLIARSIMETTHTTEPIEPVTVYRADPEYALPTTNRVPNANPFDPYSSREGNN